MVTTDGMNWITLTPDQVKNMTLEEYKRLREDPRIREAKELIRGKQAQSRWYRR